MEELVEGTFKLIARLLLPLLRVIIWIVWELMCEMVLWYIGWIFLRIFTFGYYPKEGFAEEDKALLHTFVFTMLVGLSAPLFLAYLLNIYVFG